MAERLLPVRINFDGERDRKVLIGFAEVAEFEEKYGKNLWDSMRAQPFLTVRECVFMGTRTGDASMRTPKDANKLIQAYLSRGGTLDELITAVHNALKFSGVFREEERKDDDETQATEGNAPAAENAASSAS